jgi:REP element-mobilizing transposase RayT
VQDSLLHFDDLRYKLLAWVIMPNHVHVLFETSADWEMSKIVASWKSWTAGKIAQIICASKGAAEVTGAVGTDLGHNLFARGRMQCPVWHREYWDRYIRDERHLTAAVAYIENNPVKAGLAKSPDSWPWGSARYRKSREANEMPDG